MRTIVLRVDSDAPDPGAIAEAAACLRRGGLVAFPTETVYGLGVHALDAAAVRRLFAAKGRPSNDPLIVHVATLHELASLTDHVPDEAHTLAEHFWPGALTLVLPKAAAVPREVTAGLETVAVRIPSHPVARALLEAAALPVAAPSANLFSRPSPTRAEHVLEDLDGRIDLVLDGGATRVGVESTVLDVSGAEPVVLRPGAVTLEALRRVLPGVRMSRREPASDDQAMPSPGLLTKHYSPRAPLTLYEGADGAVRARMLADAREVGSRGRRVGVLVTREHAADFGGSGVRVADLGSEHDIEEIAARLYAALRELDAAAVDVILARAPRGEQGLGEAVRDRLRRAAAGRIIRVQM